MRNRIRIFFGILAVAFAMTGCTISYSFTGASIPTQAKTVSIAYFPNNAPMVAPTLSSTLTSSLQDKFARQTKLQIVEENGDLAFEGEITNYATAPAAVTAAETAARNRLTITVKVKFTNAIDDKMSFNKNFSAYADYDSTKLLPEVEGELITQIVEQLVTDIFQAAASNW